MFVGQVVKCAGTSGLRGVISTLRSKQSKKSFILAQVLGAFVTIPRSLLAFGVAEPA